MAGDAYRLAMAFSGPRRAPPIDRKYYETIRGQSARIDDQAEREVEAKLRHEEAMLIATRSVEASRRREGDLLMNIEELEGELATARRELAGREGTLIDARSRLAELEGNDCLQAILRRDCGGRRSTRVIVVVRVTWKESSISSHSFRRQSSSPAIFDASRTDSVGGNAIIPAAGGAFGLQGGSILEQEKVTHDPLLPFPETSLRHDTYDDVTLDVTSLLTSSVERHHSSMIADGTSFGGALGRALEIWTETGRRGIWIKIPTSHTHLIDPACAVHGFDFHHAKRGYCVLTRWLPAGGGVSRLPDGPTHHPVTGKMLSVREKSGPAARAKLCNLRQEVVNNPLACQDSISSKFSNKCNLRQEVVNNPLACQDDNTFRKFYYALYGGWAFPKTPYLFQTPLEACCWCISRFKRDGLSNIFGINNFPEFLNYIGVITTEVKNVEDCSVPFKSSIERKFFSGVKFYNIKTSTAIRASYERVELCNLQKITNLFKPTIDFQRSASSTYRSSNCLAVPIFQSIIEHNDQLSCKMKDSLDNIIRFENVCSAIKDHAFDDFDVVSNYIRQYSSLSKYKKIVVSVCAGRGETEMFSQDLCLCLDIDRQSFFSSMFAMKFLFKKKAKNIIYHRHDMSMDLYSLLEKIGTITQLPVTVLFQHPSPSISPIKLSIAARDCFLAVANNVIQNVHFVYDVHLNPKKHYWKYERMMAILAESCPLSILSQIVISSEETISDVDSVVVKHPVFGQVPHLGWASMKKGKEMTFSVIKKT